MERPSPLPLIHLILMVVIVVFVVTMFSSMMVLRSPVMHLTLDPLLVQTSLLGSPLITAEQPMDFMQLHAAL